MTRTRARAALGALALLLAALVSPPSTHAQERDEDPTEVSDEVREEARRLLAEAGAHHDAGRFALAVEGYMALYQVLHDAGITRAAVALWNAGLALMEIPGRARDARDTFQRFLDESAVLTDDPQVRDWRSSAVQRIAELDTRIAGQEPEPQPVSPPEQAETDEAEPTPTQEPSTTVSPVGPIVLGVGVLTLGVGGIFGALALTADADLGGRCGGPRCLDTPENRATYDQMRTFGIATDALLIVGGLAAITGAILTFTLTEGTIDSETTASVRLYPGGSALTVRGSF